MPGYNEFLEAETAAKMMSNMLPSDGTDTSGASWEPIGLTANNLSGHLAALAKVTTGSQKELAEELKATADQLVQAVLKISLLDQARLAAADEDAANALIEQASPELATTRAAVTGFIGQFDRFDQAKLKRKRFIFG